MSTGGGITINVQRGRAFTRRIQLLGLDGRAVTGYAGSESVSGVVWAGDDRAQLFAPTVAWVGGSTTDVNVSGTTVNTDVEPGSYPLEITAGSESFFAGWLVVAARPAAATAPKVYCDLDDLRMYGGAWLDRLQTKADQAGFAEQRGRARSTIDDWILDRVCMGLASVSSTYATRRATYKAYLDADGLKIGGAYPDRIVEVAARLALAILLDGQLGEKDPTPYQSHARAQRDMAWELWRSTVVQIDTDADGLANEQISMAATAIRLERG